MKLFNKKLILAVAGAMIVFATGCSYHASRPTPDQTVPAISASTENDRGYSTVPISGPTTNASGQFGTGVPSNIFATAVTTGTDDTFSQRIPDGGTLANGQIRGITSLQPILFDFDQSAIKRSEYGKIQALKDYLDKNPTQRVLLEGHCDWRGTAEYNMALGDRRANAVKSYAIRIGIPAAKIDTVSLGSTQATERGTEAEMAKDRRGEIVILVK